ncbi:Telomerase reverse transcriptase [Savitreella phatthalungensis]
MTARAALQQVYARLEPLCHFIGELRGCQVPGDPAILVGLTKNAPIEILETCEECSLEKNASIHQVIEAVIVRLIETGDSRHLLSRGFSLVASNEVVSHAGQSKQTLVNERGNVHVESIRTLQWARLLSVATPAILWAVLLHCDLYVAHIGDNFQQISGRPLPDTLPRKRSTGDDSSQPGRKRLRTSRDIVFQRCRIFHSKPTLDAGTRVVFGQRHLHVLNRLLGSGRNLRRSVLLQYIFPREWGLHNVFTSQVDKTITHASFQEYSLRLDVNTESCRRRYPKRLRNEKLLSAIDSLYRRHHSCPYHALLQDYCPTRTGTCGELQQLAVPSERVAAYISAVINRVVPQALLGEPCKAALKRHLHTFVCLGRFDPFSLHDALQGLSPDTLPWLPSIRASRGERDKRLGLLSELLYWLVDSFIMPLLRSTFYITEMHGHGNRLFHFRHDDWRTASSPHLNKICSTMLSEMPIDEAVSILRRRKLGSAKLRLLPKPRGMRLIMNLRQRSSRLDANGRPMRGENGRSINGIMAPVKAAIAFERSSRPENGFSVSSVEDVVRKIAEHRPALSNRKLYFVKLDIKSCFDSIDQVLVQRILHFSSDSYVLGRYCQTKVDRRGRMLSRWTWRAIDTRRADSFSSFITDTAGLKRHRILLDAARDEHVERDTIVGLLDQHLCMNICRLGSKYYRQILGIPQGSVLSTLLCNHYLEAMECAHLSFLQKEDDTFISRFVDDYLLITPSRESAERFLQVMHTGISEFGLEVNKTKTVINFETSVQGQSIESTHSRFMPYCGLLIDTHLLDVSKDYAKFKFNSLQVSPISREQPQETALATIKVNLRRIFVEAHLAGRHSTTRVNIYNALLLAASRYEVQILHLRRHSMRIYDSVMSFANLAFGFLISQQVRAHSSVLGREHFCWLTLQAFREFSRGRAGCVLRQLQLELKCSAADLRMLRRVITSDMARACLDSLRQK